MISPHELPKDFIPPHIISGLPESTPILVGFSGGADSSALLNMLSAFGKSHNTLIYAAHVNHGIRGREADRDEKFCRDMCERLGIRLFVHRADVPAIAKENRESIETAARRVRYEFFDRIMSEEGIPLLATAHNADDNLETMIFNLVRGASLSGICGIPLSRPCAYGTVIRPILSMPKSDIIDFCGNHGIKFVIDSTNTDTDYTRNKIRAEMIPLLKEINSGAVRNSARLSASLRADALCLDSMRDMFLEGFWDGRSIELEKINGSPDAIVNRALVYLYRQVSEQEGLEYSHIEGLRQLARNGIPHSAISLPNGIEGVIEGGRLFIKKVSKKKDIPPYDQELSEGENRISQTNCEIIILNSQKKKNIYKNSILMSLESATIKGSLKARSRLPGDKILMGGMHKSVKKLMCDKKIPLELRARIPIIYDSSGILAIPFVGIRDGCAWGRSNDPTEIVFLMY